MYELTLASSIVELVRSEQRAHARGLPRRISVRVGEFSGVDPETLRSGVEALVRETDLAGMKLEIEKVPHRRQCPTCRREYDASPWDPRCPECGDTHTVLTSGNELDVRVLESQP
ncbi:MAG: hydrogenase maturation nickel metallochaperone HypA [bacterium]